MIKVGIAGASGYTGLELIRLLANHPEVELSVLTSETYKKKSIVKLGFLEKFISFLLSS